MSERRSELNIGAQPFLPKDASRTPLTIQTVRPSAGKWVCFDAVPFTPSQGVVTPSPTNIAAQRFYQHHLGPWAQQMSPMGTQPMSPAHFANFHQHGWTPGLVDSRHALDSVGSESDASAASEFSPAVSPAGSTCVAPGGHLVFQTPFFWQRVVSPETMQAMAYYGSPAVMQPCYLGARGSMPMSSPQQHPYAGPVMLRQVFQQQPSSQFSVCGTPASAQATRHVPQPVVPACLTPLPLRDSSFGKPLSVSGSDRSSQAGGPSLTEVADVLRRSAELAEPLPAQVVQLAQLVHGYGLEHLEPGLDALRGRCPADSQSAKPAGASARLNARQRRTLRRAFERAKAALNNPSRQDTAVPNAAVIACAAESGSQRVSDAGDSRDPSMYRQCSNDSTDTEHL